MAYGYAMGYPKLWVCHNDTLQKALLKPTYRTFAVFPILMRLPALIQRKLTLLFSQIHAGCCSFGVCGGHMCGCVFSAYNFLAFYWHNHSLSLQVFQVSAGCVTALKIVFHFKVNTKSHYRDTKRKLPSFPQCVKILLCANS